MKRIRRGERGRPSAQKKPRSGRRPPNTLAAAYLRDLMQLVSQRGVAPERILEGTALRGADLAAPDARAGAADCGQAMLNAIRLTGDGGLGFALGLQTKPTTHGYLGYVMLSCGTLRESLEANTRFFHLRQRAVGQQLAVAGAEAVIEIREVLKLGELRTCFLEALLVCLARTISLVLGVPLPELRCEIEFDWPEPPYYAAYREHLPRVRFSMPAVALRFPASLLQRQPVLADPCAAQRAVEHCERELALCGSAPVSVADRVRAEIMRSHEDFPDLPTVAARLHLSTRTLKRRLRQHGTSFHALSEEERRRRAQRLVEHSAKSIQQIASALGYQNPAAFTRAYRRWTGFTPTQTRQRQTGPAATARRASDPRLPAAT
ncbi:MAG: AraC family transcriptional regulator ligand-binding domain-containing protein [Nevskia sp.]|nr:AraC family transcriptional regulator ligand-binding domain-containing protein [Nevskia sp.]